MCMLIIIRCEAFVEAEVNEILSHQPHQLVTNDNILTLGTQMVPETLAICNKLTWLTAQEDFIRLVPVFHYKLCYF